MGAMPFFRNLSSLTEGDPMKIPEFSAALERLGMTLKS
ncbi:MAG: hypothetical protein JWP75_321 [Frondihabitans sp.]|nr:hypothetical protein [Frondihabitans sp.]